MSNSTETITVRVPRELKRIVKLEAKRANLTLANYVRKVLTGVDIESLPMLAVLAQIIAITAIVEADPTQSASTLAELRALVEQMSLLAYREVRA
jgi:hypothetical protein